MPRDRDANGGIASPIAGSSSRRRDAYDATRQPARSHNWGRRAYDAASPRTPAAAKRKGEHWPAGAPSAARTVPRCDSQTRAGGSAVVKRDLLVGYSIADGLEPSPPELRRCPFPCQQHLARTCRARHGTQRAPDLPRRRITPCGVRAGRRGVLAHRRPPGSLSRHLRVAAAAESDRRCSGPDRAPGRE